MDLERATLRTLFYDYPVEVAMRHIAHLPFATPENDLLLEFPQVIRWTEQQFSISELRMVENMLHYEAQNVIHNYDSSRTNIFRDVLCLIPQVAKSWLSYDANRNEVVHFKDLFRWRDMTLLVGEDILTTAFIAREDIRRCQPERQLFVWEDILHHDNKALNEILKQENADVHSHYNASIDVFHINWMSLMNRIENRIKFDFDKGDYQENSVSLHAVEQIFKFKNICVAAAYLRVWLFRFLTLNNKDDFNFKIFKEVEQILKDDLICVEKQKETQEQIDILKCNALKDINGNSVDYALCIPTCNSETIDTPYIIYQGERQLLYKLFRYIFDSNASATEVAPYVYLYLLLKNRIRREIVETNQLLGFENFQIYQSRKDLFIRDKKADNVYDHISQFIFRLNTVDGLSVEERVTPGSVSKTRVQSYYRPIFPHEELLEDIDKGMSLVAHFIKDGNIPSIHVTGKNRIDIQKKYQTKINKQATQILSEIEKQKNIEKGEPILRLVGVDAASLELYCRPERFGHIYRFLELHGVHNRTYHVGEDFFDIVDGLRAIHEAIEFLQLDNNCRIGHALALGTNAEKYYCARHYTTITNKQYMLDSLVWLYQIAYENNILIRGSLYTYIQNTAARLYNEIGYNVAEPYTKESHPFDILHYWHSMWLRSDGLVEDKNSLCQNEWLQSIEYKGHYSAYTTNNQVARDLHSLYIRSPKVYRKGAQVEIFKWPKEIVEVVTQIQDKMIAEIAEKQIAIECNPSSNVKIGHFDRYDEHPIFRFRPIDKNIHTPLLNVSINTDDRGVFATSLYNEFSLIALALTKQRDKDGNRLYNDEAICEYIDHIRKNNIIQRFKV